MVARWHKAMLHIRKEIKEITIRKNLALPTGVIITRLNELVRGWAGYFYYQHNSKAFSLIKDYLEERVRTYLRRKHRVKGRGYKAYPAPYLYKRLGLYRIPTTAAWTANASGRR
jgi:RNA-directed DNA polymerase